MKLSKKPVYAILTAAVIQGSTFPLQKLVLPGVSFFVFNALRFGLAAIVSLFVFGVGKPSKGVILGSVLSVGYIAQTWGLTLTSASKGGFIVSLYIVIIPVFAYLLGKERLTLRQGVALLASALGSYLLTGGVRGFNFGDLLMLIGAVSFALHIVLITEFTRRIPEKELVFPQFLTVSLISGMLGVKGDWLLDVPTYLVIAYTAVFATAMGIYIQLKFQREIGSNRTALIYVVLPVTSAVLSCLILGERLTLSQLVGASLMIAASIFSQITA